VWQRVDAQENGRLIQGGSHDVTIVTGDHITVGDQGTNDTALLFGNDDGANLAGNGTVVSTGRATASPRATARPSRAQATTTP
jgi:hypothetical protein